MSSQRWSNRIAVCYKKSRPASLWTQNVLFHMSISGVGASLSQQTPTTLPSGYPIFYNREKVQGWLKEEELLNTLNQARLAVRAGFDCLKSQFQSWGLLVIRITSPFQPLACILLDS